MALHDKLAYKAVMMGKNAAQFNEAAQKHANATWAILIVAASIWYFTSLKWAIALIIIGLFTAYQSVSSTMIATRLENIGRK